MISITEHGYTLRGGPRDGMETTAPSMPNGITAVHFPCNISHEEHADRVAAVETSEYHQHSYVFGADHPYDINYSGTTYRIKNVSTELQIAA